MTESVVTEPASWRLRLFALAACLCGLVGLGLFFAFLVLNGLEWWSPRGSGDGWFPWAWNTLLLALFALQHSGMARERFKTWEARWLPVRVERAVYVGVSGILMMVLVATWQTLPGEPLWRGQYWLLAVNAAGQAILGWAMMATDGTRFLGLAQVGAGPSTFEPDRLTVAGPYRWIRHPLLAGTLLFLWAHPTMTPALVFLSGGLSLYILLAIPLEERDLRRRFGPAYEEYRGRVPALIPWRW